MSDKSLTDRIDDITAPVCGQCGTMLNPDGESPDFCTPECQRAWTEHHNAVEAIVGYREAADAAGDSMVVEDGRAGGLSLDSFALENLRRLFLLSEHRERSRRRTWRTLLLIAAGTALTFGVQWWGPDVLSTPVTVAHLLFLVVLNVISWKSSKRDERDLMAHRRIGSTSMWRRGDES